MFGLPTEVVVMAGSLVLGLYPELVAEVLEVNREPRSLPD